MRLLVTRPEQAAQRTAERLNALGHDTIVSPLMRIVPTLTEPPAIPEGAFAIATSASAPDMLEKAGFGPLISSLDWIVVGEATGKAVRALGGRVVLTGEGDAEALANILLGTGSLDGHALFFAGRDHNPTLPDRLRSAGRPVSVVETYAAEPLSRLGEEADKAIRDETLDGVLLYSPRSAKAFGRALHAAGLQNDTQSMTAYCLSDAVAEAARLSNFKRLSVAEAPNEAALFARLT